MELVTTSCQGDSGGGAQALTSAWPLRLGPHWTSFGAHVPALNGMGWLRQLRFVPMVWTSALWTVRDQSNAEIENKCWETYFCQFVRVIFCLLNLVRQKLGLNCVTSFKVFHLCSNLFSLCTRWIASLRRKTDGSPEAGLKSVSLRWRVRVPSSVRGSKLLDRAFLSRKPVGP